MIPGRQCGGVAVVVGQSYSSNSSDSQNLAPKKCERFMCGDAEFFYHSMEQWQNFALVLCITSLPHHANGITHFSFEWSQFLQSPPLLLHHCCATVDSQLKVFQLPVQNWQILPVEMWSDSTCTTRSLCCCHCWYLMISKDIIVLKKYIYNYIIIRHTYNHDAFITHTYKKLMHAVMRQTARMSASFCQRLVGI